MKQIFRLAVLTAAMILAGCSGHPEKKESVHPDWSYDAVIYEMNVRQYTPEGTFEAAAEELPRLQRLGVDVIWLMPVYPIGVEQRKGTLGSYYAISDYRAINPEFGDMQDFDDFLAEAHDLGFKVILDWVANHTSPDAVWESGKPADWYVRDSLGRTVTQYDWTDIAELNYDNADMREEMRSCMRFWLDKGVDGFRCDMACEVPMDFWRETLPELRREYPGIRIVAYRNGYLKTPEERAALIDDVAAKRPDFVFVAMGSPKQELLMEEMMRRHPAIYQGLGGSFDVYTGHVKRAPRWWVDHNLEFLYRLIHQPSRIKRQIHLLRYAYWLAFHKL